MYENNPNQRVSSALNISQQRHKGMNLNRINFEKSCMCRKNIGYMFICVLRVSTRSVFARNKIRYPSVLLHTNGSKDVKLVETDKKNMMNILISSLSPALIRLVYVNIINLAFCLLMTYYSAFKHIYAQFINIFIPQFQICSMNLFF